MLSPTIYAASAKSSACVSITWSKGSGDTSYEVYRSMSAGGVHNKIASLTVNTFTDTGLRLGTTYYYKIKGGVFYAKTSNRIERSSASYCMAVEPCFLCRTLHLCICTGSNGLDRLRSYFHVLLYAERIPFWTFVRCKGGRFLESKVAASSCLLCNLRNNSLPMAAIWLVFSSGRINTGRSADKLFDT